MAEATWATEFGTISREFYQDRISDVFRLKIREVGCTGCIMVMGICTERRFDIEQLTWTLRKNRTPKKRPGPSVSSHAYLKSMLCCKLYGFSILVYRHLAFGK